MTVVVEDSSANASVQSGVPRMATLQWADAALWLSIMAACLTELATGAWDTTYREGYLLGAGFSLLLLAAHITCAIGLKKGWRSGRALQFVFAVIALVRLPFGTLLGLGVLRTLRGSTRWRLGLLWTLDLLIIPAVIAPLWLASVPRAHAKRTMADMRQLATAAEAHATDHDRYPRASSAQELTALLTPTYAKTLAAEDAWGTALRYAVSEDGKSYVVASAGSDGAFETDDLFSYVHAPTTASEADIVIRNGDFLRYPEATGN